MYIKYSDDPIKRRVNSAFGSLCDGDPIKNTLKLVNGCFSIFDREKLVSSFCEFNNFTFPVDGFTNLDLEICQGQNEIIFSNALVGGTTATSATTLNSTAVTLAFANNLIRVGSTVSGIGITAGTTVVAISGTALTLSSPATATNPNTVLTFVEVLNPNKSYVKGVLLFVKYPKLDEDGAEIDPSEYIVTGNISSIFSNGGNSSSNFTIGEAYMYFAPDATTDPTKIVNSLSILNPSTKFSVKVSALLIKTKTNPDPNSSC